MGLHGDLGGEAVLCSGCLQTLEPGRLGPQLPLPSCVNLGKLFNLSVLVSSSRSRDPICFIGFLSGLMS